MTKRKDNPRRPGRKPKLSCDKVIKVGYCLYASDIDRLFELANYYECSVSEALRYTIAFHHFDRFPERTSELPNKESVP